jgi:hypothetical protein
MPGTCTTRDVSDHSYELSLNSHQQFHLLKPDKIFVLIALVAISYSDADYACDMHDKGWCSLFL